MLEALDGLRDGPRRQVAVQQIREKMRLYGEPEPDHQGGGRSGQGGP